MQLLPDLGHGPAFAGIAAIALLMVGLGNVAGARRAETALIVGWGLMSLAAVALGTLTTLSPAAAIGASALVGGIGLVRAVLHALAGKPVLLAGTALRVLALSAPLLLLLESIRPAAWDDLSHWLPNLHYLAFHGHFPTLAEPDSWSFHAGYPPADSLPAYALFLATGTVFEQATIYWNAVLLIAACATISALLEWRGHERPTARYRWGLAALSLLVGVMLNPSFTPKFALSSMTDGATGAVLAVICRLIFDVYANDDDADGRGARMSCLAFSGAALTLLRQTNLILLVALFAGFGVAALAGPNRRWRRVGVELGLPLLVAVAAWGLWQQYAARQIPNGEMSFLAPHEWRWSLLPAILLSIVSQILSHIRFYGLQIVLGVCVARQMARGRQLDVGGMLAASVCIVSAVDIAFLAFTYFGASFNDEEAAKAASFWRYSQQTGLATLLALAAVVPLQWLDGLALGPAAIAACAAAFVAPILLPGFVRYDLHSGTYLLRRIAEDVSTYWSWDRPIRLVAPQRVGYGALALSYELHRRALAAGHEASAVKVINPPQKLTRSAADDVVFRTPGLVWLSGGIHIDPGQGQLALNAECSYLLKVRQQGFDVLRSWSGRVLPGGALEPCTDRTDGIAATPGRWANEAAPP